MASVSAFAPDDKITVPPATATTLEPTTTQTDQELPESVHMKLNNQSISEEEENGDGKKKKKGPEASTVRVHRYKDPKSKVTWTALNIPKRKFESYLLYSGIVKRNPRIESQVINDDQQRALRFEWRKLWKERRLITDRTELLVVYPSEADKKKEKESRRGGFNDLLSLYTDRLMAVWRDEQEEPLMEWLTEHCPNTSDLLPKTFARLRSSEKFTILKTFLEWFRSEFPYFYDRCEVCGASIKEDGPSNEKSDDDETFVGYIYPSENEIEGKASRTELYRCHKCHSFTRFPRYNSARYVLENRRGRCGEYSMLLYRFLRTLGHDCRWVVDWADHVWAEIRVNDRWIHMDPCEAALDHNLLYQEWGKKQTFVLGFCLPSGSNQFKYPLIEDITHQYTTDAKCEILNRRDESDDQVKHAIEKATKSLRARLVGKQ